MSLAESPSPRRPAWIVILPAGLLLLAAIGWTAAWFYASGRVSGEIDAWIAREATQGRNWSCADRSIGGFPFRFELVCTEPTLTFSGPSQWKVTSRRAHAVAQVWDPQHIIAEF